MDYMDDLFDEYFYQVTTQTTTAIHDDVICDDCQDFLAGGDEIICSCAANVCENCYFERGHAGHDDRAENAWLRQGE